MTPMTVQQSEQKEPIILYRPYHDPDQTGWSTPDRNTEETQCQRVKRRGLPETSEITGGLTRKTETERKEKHSN